jgi:hypothetical protein
MRALASAALQILNARVEENPKLFKGVGGHLIWGAPAAVAGGISAAAAAVEVVLAAAAAAVAVVEVAAVVVRTSASRKTSLR